MKLSIVSMCAALFLFSQCGKNQEKASTAVNEPSAESDRFEVDESFRQQLTGLFDSYIAMKNSFVASDAEQAQKAAEQSLSALGNTDMTSLTGEAHAEWMDYADAIKEELTSISMSADLETQREHFQRLSDTLYQAISAFGLHETTAYYTYCPMAFDNEGAYWLSDDSAIRNPYFGDKMLTCGKVTAVVQ